MPKTPDEIKLSIECCINERCVHDCIYYEKDYPDCKTALIRAMNEYINQLEAERDAFKEALGLMVYQYCVRGDKLDHMYMCAGETAFRVLGLEQYGDTRTLESWLFPECQEEET